MLTFIQAVHISQCTFLFREGSQKYNVKHVVFHHNCWGWGGGSARTTPLLQNVKGVKEKMNIDLHIPSEDYCE